mmetsp:Transcript_20759/g.62530  ORF Transcript_20759/g.62530 Transcript_20759/m.62530 type:complete len:280 (-) Transcript_20759:468-1307(-)
MVQLESFGAILVVQVVLIAIVLGSQYTRFLAAPLLESCNTNVTSAPGHFTAAYHAPPGSGSIIHDLTYNITTGAHVFESSEGVPAHHREVFQRRRKGDICNQSTLKLDSAHTGTHLDAPSHFSDRAFNDGRGVESLSLHTLNGPALLVEVPAGTNITAAALEALDIPRGLHRLLFRTDNTKRGLMCQLAFDPSYTAFTLDGARWLTRKRPEVRLIGIDYLTIATYADLKGPHEELLDKGVIAVEGLNLEALGLGLHMLHCLPLKLAGSDGAPVRCITIA